MVKRSAIRFPVLPIVVSLLVLHCETAIAQRAAVSGCGDERDTIIKEYTDNGVAWTPGCADFSQNAHSDHFTFDEFNVSGDYSWAIVEASLTIPDSSSYGLERWRKEYGASRIINSAYRNPKHNNQVGGAKDSRHMYGDATDLRNESRTEDEWSNMQAAATRAKADYIEPRNGPCDIGCVHADWRSTGGTQSNLLQEATPDRHATLNLQALARTASTEDRAKMFETFVRAINGGQRKRNYDAIAKALPTDAAESLIELLSKENESVKSLPKAGSQLSETYTDYYADLIGTVAGLHNPAAIPALLKSAPTGWLAIRGITQFGAAALPPSAKILEEGDIPERRAAALIIKTILSDHQLSAAQSAAVIPAIKVALEDPDGYTRLTALESVATLPRDEFSAKVHVMQQKDEFRLGSEFPIRKLAGQIVKGWGQE
jgi:hypothetical protein